MYDHVYIDRDSFIHVAINFTITLVSLIEVQDILINFQHFSSQEALIGDRTFINFSKKFKA